MDFSESMLDLCRAKGIATDLRRHDLQNVPWPYGDGDFDHVICCGVMHFIAELDVLIAETARLLRTGGLFAFTVKQPQEPADNGRVYERESSGGLDVFSHSPTYLKSLLEKSQFEQMKMLRCYVGQDVFGAWVVRKKREEKAREP
jgi:predicted TPR repeat methyltransferase